MSYSTLNDAKQGMAWFLYNAARNKLDLLSEGYSDVETATWPHLEVEINTHNATGAVGPFMSSIIARGRLSAPQVVALLTPKFTYTQAVLQARDNGVLALLACTDINLIEDLAATHCNIISNI
jgi:hypothetical protein